jgi:Domain of Unknown Function (DUF1080)
MKSIRQLARIILFTTFCVAGLQICAADDPFLGYWSLHLPGGGTGWLGVSGSGDDLKAEMLWIGGSVFPLDSAKIEDGKLIVTRQHETDRKSPDGKPVIVTETLTATLDGNNLHFVTVTPKPDGGENRAEFSGHRQPPLPPTPDLSVVKFGEPIQLFNGTNLDGWRLVEPGAASGWRAADGILANDITQVPGQPERHFGNLRTVAEFEDFSLHAETRLATNGNSGIYLRGIDEVQVFDSFGKPTDSHNMGAIYSRIKPLVAAEKPAGEWQTLDIIFLDRHVTVTLNGTKIIDNQPVLGPTGGALWPEVDSPGPIYLQGDHTGIEYRNLVLRPVVKE